MFTAHMASVVLVSARVCHESCGWVQDEGVDVDAVVGVGEGEDVDVGEHDGMVVQHPSMFVHVSVVGRAVVDRAVIQLQHPSSPVQQRRTTMMRIQFDEQQPQLVPVIVVQSY